MNNTLDRTFEQNFNKIMNLAESEQSYDELIEMLRSDSIAKKQLAAIKLEEIKSFDDAKLLVSKLTNQDGKIREAVAFKINKLIKNNDYKKYFLAQENYEIFSQAIMDIDGNVCREIIDVVEQLKNNNTFSEYFSKNLVISINSIWANIEKLDLTAKQYVISKRNFQLYWALETLAIFKEVVNIKELKQILLKCGTFYDYTIREKVAKILSAYKTSDIELLNLSKDLSEDENYFVRLALKS